MSYKNPEDKKEQGKRWREDHKEELRLKYREYRLAHLDQIQQREKEYAQEHKEEKKAVYDKWYDANRGRGHGLKPADIERMLVLQDGKCALCKKTDSGPYDWNVDHDHQTGQIRGLLCGTCNRGLGMFYENPETLRRAADYLEKHRAITSGFMVSLKHERGMS